MTDRVKLLFIIDCYKSPYAGTEGQLLKLVQGLDRDQFEARLVIFKPSEYLHKHEFPVPVDVIGIERLLSPLSWWKLYQYLRNRRNEGYRLAHIYFNDASIIGPPILRMLDYRTIISRRDMGYWYTISNRLVLRLNARLVDRVIANSNAVRKLTLDMEGYKSDQMDVIYNGFQEKAAISKSSNLDIELDERAINIVLVANLRPIKRVQDAIYALERILKTISNVSLYVIGDGDDIDLFKLANKLNIKDSVHFTGVRDNVSALLPLFDIGVLCSESEGFSNTLIEYMQAGLPVVCTNTGGNPEIIEHGINGYLYKVGDIYELSRLVLELCEDKELSKKMGDHGKSKVRRCYSLERYIKNHQDTYKDLAESEI